VRASQLPTNVLGQEPTAVNTPRGGNRAPGEEPTRALETRRITVAAASESTMVMDRYRLTKRLGSGAFGTVWSARDERLDRDVAVKILPRERVIHARFEREARAAARLQHPAIVTLYEAAVDDDGAYLVSELVRGRTLDALLEQGKLSDREILEVGVSLCDALAHAHGQGVIHRDVKPSNVLVPSRGGGGRAGGIPYGDRAKLTDFGVAHVIGGATLTHTGDVVGTLAYMAPEQAEGHEAGPEADLYSLALILYEALTGVNPQAESRRYRRTTFVPPLRRQRRDLSRQLAAGIDLALRPRPYDRGGLLDLRATLLHSLDQADDTPGVVAPGWRSTDDDTRIGPHPPGPGPEWRERGHDDTPRLRLSRDAGAGGFVSSTTAAALGAAWLPRAANAAGAGLGAAWLCTHLWHHAPVPPAVAALVAAVVALMLPLVGSLLTGVALGVVSLGAALPAVVAQVGYSWWQRALFAAGGLVALVGVSRATHHNLYWLPSQLPPHHTLELAAVGVWAAGAAIQPLLRVRRFPLLELLLCAVWSTALVMGVEAVGLRSVSGELPGALLGMAIVAWRPVLAMIDETRYAAGIHTGVS
jgi:serine/threonine protein kinase